MDSGITAWIFVPHIPLPAIRLPWQQIDHGPTIGQDACDERGRTTAGPPRPGGQPGTYEQNVDILLAEYDYDLLPDGRRAGLTEKIWLDDGNGMFDPSELAETRIDWAYDPVGRLVRESSDSHDNSLDYVTDYVVDLVGNRLLKLSDTDPAVTGRDQTVTYSYDINDRLLLETAATCDGGTSAWITDRTTLYEYGPNANPAAGTAASAFRKSRAPTRSCTWWMATTPPATRKCWRKWPGSRKPGRSSAPSPSGLM